MDSRLLSFSIAVTENDPSTRLDLFLSRTSEQSRVFVQTQIKKGRVQLNGHVETKPSTLLKRGDKVECEFKEPASSPLAPLEGPLDIIYEDDDLMAINKAQGVVVHPAVGHRGATLVHYLLHYLSTKEGFTELSQIRPGIVHRLDRGTSGVMLVAKNRQTQEALSLQFKNREIKKQYECIVWGQTQLSGTIETAIGRHNWDRKKMSTKSRVAREAKTVWKKNKGFTLFTLLDVFPHTGRTHQIRVHLSESGHPIVGDALYATRSIQGRKKQVPEKLWRIISTSAETFLHAKHLTFKHPRTLALLSIEAKRPAAFETFLSLLEETNS